MGKSLKLGMLFYLKSSLSRILTTVFDFLSEYIHLKNICTYVCFNVYI